VPLGYYSLRLALHPDVSHYTSGGVGWFPSPVGRALGSLGVWGLVAGGSLTSGLIVARIRQDRAVLAALPVLVWMVPAGMDAAGALVAGLAIAGAWSPMRTRRVLGLALLAVAVHPGVVLALAPALYVSGRSGLRRASVYGSVVMLLALASSPYRAIFQVTSWSAGALAFAIVAASLVLALAATGTLDARSAPVALLIAGGAGWLALATGEAGAHFMRYGLPLMVGVLSVGFNRAGLRSNGKPAIRPASLDDHAMTARDVSATE
jgi:hypothetical protein